MLVGVDGLMMGTQLTLDLLLRRAETLFPRKEVVSRRPDRTLARTTYAELAYIAGHAGDRLAVVDDVLAPVLESFRERAPFERVIVAPGEYEELLAGADEAAYEEPALDEDEAAATCYTSGTSGRPKGVVYSHRALVLHSVASAMADLLGIAERDVVMPVVPMFHANAWGLPYTAALVG